MVTWIAVIALPVVFSVGTGPWGYHAHNGPENWEKTCQDGFRQSPIDIHASDVDYALLHRMHFVHYDHAGPVNVSNTGRSVIVSGFEQWGSRQPLIQGGGLKHKYKLVQFHLHWAQLDNVGSEHKIGGLHYPAELHLVHVRSDLNMVDAIRRPDGLAVVGVFLTVGHDGSSVASLSSALENVVHTGNQTSMQGFRTRPLLPSHTEAFYRYDGSLTTPGCDEAVIWTVLAEPISVTKSQLKELRQIHSTDSSPMSHNYRPVQPLNGRRVLYRPSQFDKTLLCGTGSALAILIAFCIPLTYFL